MKEILVNVIQDWILFSSLESIWFCLYFVYIGNLNKMKWHQVGIMGIGNAFLSQIFPAVVYQVFIVLWMSLLLKNNNEKEKILNCIKIVVFSIAIFFVLEVNYNILLENVFNFQGLKILSINEKLYLFILMIPIRIIEILMIFIVKKIKEVNGNMKIVLGTGTTRK